MAITPHKRLTVIKLTSLWEYRSKHNKTDYSKVSPEGINNSYTLSLCHRQNLASVSKMIELSPRFNDKVALIFTFLFTLG